jgi:hypothetical protein
MGIFTSESDSNTFVGEEMQRHLSYCFFSLTTDLNRFSRNPRVAAAWDGLAGCVPGVRVHYILLLTVCQFLSSPDNGYFEGR